MHHNGRFIRCCMVRLKAALGLLKTGIDQVKTIFFLHNRNHFTKRLVGRAVAVTDDYLEPRAFKLRHDVIQQLLIEIIRHMVGGTFQLACRLTIRAIAEIHAVIRFSIDLRSPVRCYKEHRQHDAACSARHFAEQAAALQTVRTERQMQTMPFKRTQRKVGNGGFGDTFSKFPWPQLFIQHFFHDETPSSM